MIHQTFTHPSSAGIYITWRGAQDEAAFSRAKTQKIIELIACTFNRQSHSKCLVLHEKEAHYLL
jgi:hypothetical protein